MTMGILERLKNGIVLGAEGYPFELERRGYLQAGPFVPEVVLDAPEGVTDLHREFLKAGAEVMVAFTYYAHRTKLRTIGREADLERLNRQALRLAADRCRSEGLNRLRKLGCLLLNQKVTWRKYAPQG